MGGEDSVWSAWRADLRAATGRTSVGLVRAVWTTATRPGLLAVALLRLQSAADRHRGGRPVAALLRMVAHVLTGADFVPGCRIGPGLRLEHPTGIVLGTGAVVGRDVLLCQAVTLGERLGRDGVVGYPTVGDGVFVGAGAILIGGVRIGAGARIAAGAVVLHDVPPGATAVGNPAKVVHATAFSPPR